MVIRELTLEDFGTYAGIATFDFTTKPDQPVVLVGGTNGAGKTTVLEAILLCLHGRRSLGPTVSIREYEAHLRSRVHVPAKGTGAPKSARVTIELEHTEGGLKRGYEVTRSWELAPGGKPRERLGIERDGSPVDDLPEAAWQDFLNGLVPPGLAGLFFFDGERIQALAEDDSGHRLGEAVRQLLGLDVVDQLQRDLGRFIGSNEDADVRGLKAEVAAAAARKDAVQKAKDALAMERNALLERRIELGRRAVLEQEAFARQGGVLAKERSGLQANHEAATAKAAAAEAEVRAQVAGLLPFALCPEIATAVEARIDSEREHGERELIRDRLKATIGELGEVLEARSGEPLEAVLERVLVGDRADGSQVPVHDLTITERVVLLGQLEQIRSELPRVAKSEAATLSRAEEARTRTRELLDTAPQESDVSHLLVALQEVEREQGALEHEIQQTETSIAQQIHELKVAERVYRKATEQVDKTEGLTDRVSHAVRTAAVLEQFAERTQRSKLGRIEDEAARFFNRLSRKGSLLSRVSIDADSFQVRLARWDGEELLKERLSAGEKQLLAIALLWALATVAGRPLPVVIDTPFARLDHQHRETLLKDYLPFVSHQVIVLSTDTEIDDTAAAALGTSVTRTYRLDHDAKRCATEVSRGYFGMRRVWNVG